MKITVSQLAAFLPMIILLFVAVIAYFVYGEYKKRKNLKEASGRVWCEFWTRSGNNYDMLCEEMQGKVEQVTDRWGNKKGKTGDFVKAPKGHSISRYFVLPGTCFNAKWPPNKPSNQQITIKKTSYNENWPIPITFMEPEKWDPDTTQKVTAYLIGVSSDEAVASAAQEINKEVYADLHKVSGAVSVLDWLKWVVIAGAGISALNAALTYNAMGLDQQIIKMLMKGG